MWLATSRHHSPHHPSAPPPPACGPPSLADWLTAAFARTPHHRRRPAGIEPPRAGPQTLSPVPMHAELLPQRKIPRVACGLAAPEGLSSNPRGLDRLKLPLLLISTTKEKQCNSSRLDAFWIEPSWFDLHVTCWLMAKLRPSSFFSAGTIHARGMLGVLVVAKAECHGLTLFMKEGCFHQRWLPMASGLLHGLCAGGEARCCMV